MSNKTQPKYRFFICAHCGKAELTRIGSLYEELSLHRYCAKWIIHKFQEERR